jgi:hypothetical protein
MSITGPLMAINDRDKWIKERKQLTHPCAMNHHVTLGVEIDTSGIHLLTPDSSPSPLSNSK